jgi:hypothetical protein
MGRKGNEDSGRHAAHGARTAILAAAVPAAAAVGIALVAGGGVSSAHATAGLGISGAVVPAIPPTPRPSPAPTPRPTSSPTAGQTPAPSAGPTAPPAPATW